MNITDFLIHSLIELRLLLSTLRDSTDLNGEKNGENIFQLELSMEKRGMLFILTEEKLLQVI